MASLTDEIKVARPTPNATPTQKAVEAAVKLDQPSARTSIPMSAKDATIQSAQPINEFTGNVKKGAGIWRDSASYRPTGPKAPVDTAVKDYIESANRIGQKSSVQPMSMDEAITSKSFGAAKNAGAERVAKARMEVGAAKPVAPQVVDTTIPKYASEAARANAMGLATGAAGSLIQSPMIAESTNAALRKRGLKGIVPQKGGEEMLVTQFGRWLGGKAYDLTHPEEAAPMANNMTRETETTEKALPAGAALKNSATVGDKEPVVDFSNPSIKTEVKAPALPAKPAVSLDQTPQYTAAQIDEFAKPKAGQSGLQQAVSKGEGGNFRYVQGPNGEIVKQNLDTSEVVPMSVQGLTGNIIKPGEEGPLAREVRQRKEAAATAKEEAFRNALLQMAQSQGDGSFTGMGQAKRDRKMAQQLLSQLDARQQAAAQNALEREKMDITARNTEATREQNQLAKAADQALKQKQIDVAQEGNELRKQALENKPIRETYKDKTFQGTKESIEQQKADFDKELQAKSWDKANPKPSGLLTTNSDMLKHYQARAKALGYNPDINKASSRATAIANLLGKVSPEQADELSTEFQREYGVPYNEFIMEE